MASLRQCLRCGQCYENKNASASIRSASQIHFKSYLSEIMQSNSKLGAPVDSMQRHMNILQMKQYQTSIKQVLVCYASRYLDIAENLYMYN